MIYERFPDSYSLSSGVQCRSIDLYLYRVGCFLFAIFLLPNLYLDFVSSIYIHHHHTYSISEWVTLPTESSFAYSHI